MQPPTLAHIAMLQVQARQRAHELQQAYIAMRRVRLPAGFLEQVTNAAMKAAADLSRAEWQLTNAQRTTSN